MIENLAGVCVACGAVGSWENMGCIHCYTSSSAIRHDLCRMCLSKVNQEITFWVLKKRREALAIELGQKEAEDV